MQMQLPSDVQSEFLSISMHFPFSVWRASGRAELGTEGCPKTGQLNQSQLKAALSQLSEFQKSNSCALDVLSLNCNWTRKSTTTLEFCRELEQLCVPQAGTGTPSDAAGFGDTTQCFPHLLFTCARTLSPCQGTAFPLRSPEPKGSAPPHLLQPLPQQVEISCLVQEHPGAQGKAAFCVDHRCGMHKGTAGSPSTLTKALPAFCLQPWHLGPSNSSVS